MKYLFKYLSLSQPPTNGIGGNPSIHFFSSYVAYNDRASWLTPSSYQTPNLSNRNIYFVP